VVKKEDTAEYGWGIFLLAGSEVLKLRGYRPRVTGAADDDHTPYEGD
jgi:hypothetical protein